MRAAVAAMTSAIYEDNTGSKYREARESAGLATCDGLAVPKRNVSNISGCQ